MNGSLSASLRHQKCLLICQCFTERNINLSMLYSINFTHNCKRETSFLFNFMPHMKFHYIGGTQLPSQQQKRAPAADSMAQRLETAANSRVDATVGPNALPAAAAPEMCLCRQHLAALHCPPHQLAMRWAQSSGPT
jgi:hypothetical protein